MVSNGLPDLNPSSSTKTHLQVQLTSSCTSEMLSRPPLGNLPWHMKRLVPLQLRPPCRASCGPSVPWWTQHVTSAGDATWKVLERIRCQHCIFFNGTSMWIKSPCVCRKYVLEFWVKSQSFGDVIFRLSRCKLITITWTKVIPLPLGWVGHGHIQVSGRGLCFCTGAGISRTRPQSGAQFGQLLKALRRIWRQLSFEDSSCFLSGLPWHVLEVAACTDRSRSSSN